MKIVLLVGISFFAIGISSWAQQKALSKPSVAVLLARLEEIPEAPPNTCQAPTQLINVVSKARQYTVLVHGALPQRASDTSLRLLLTISGCFSRAQ